MRSSAALMLSAVTEEDQERLAGTLGLARRLGAEVISVTSESISAALLRTARERNVTQLVVGKPDRFRWWRASLADQLIRDSGDIDICVVRPVISGPVSTAPAARSGEERLPESLVAEYSTAMAAGFVLVSLAGGAAEWLGYMAVGLVFLLGVILASLRLRRGPVLLLTSLLALSWDFFFIAPRFTFHISRVHDVIMFVMFFIVAFSMGHLTTRLRQREKAERQRQRHTAALLRVTQSAALSADPAKGQAEALRTISEMLHAGTALVVRRQDHTLPETAHPASTFMPTPKEWGVIHWVYQNRKPAGRFTGTLPESAATWFPLQTAATLTGVFGVRLEGAARMDFGMRQAIEAIALQLALVLEKEHFLQAVRHAEMLTQSERLQRTLLDSVSHELKTPLAVIQAALEGLTDADNPWLNEIRTASHRLRRVVNNLLEMTRIESAPVQPRREWCLVGDLVRQALGMTDDSLSGHEVAMDVPPGLPAVRTDAGILCQALANLLHNAAIYTPPGTRVEISAAVRDSKPVRALPASSPQRPAVAGTDTSAEAVEGREAPAEDAPTIHQGTLELRIADHGPGIPEADLERVFEKFHRLPGSPTGGTGLGLPIAQALVRALGGGITAGNRPGGGAVFTLLLPMDLLPA
ncbi:MAG: DUF4118 domain-containing protein [Verrucomicrobiaceae bacterium]|nr:MAG: DUF4118 domain-containing protein [Verrucomicrobiaceae bacterium]